MSDGVCSLLPVSVVPTAVDTLQGIPMGLSGSIPVFLKERGVSLQGKYCCNPLADP